MCLLAQCGPAMSQAPIARHRRGFERVQPSLGGKPRACCPGAPSQGPAASRPVQVKAIFKDLSRRGALGAFLCANGSAEMKPILSPTPMQDASVPAGTLAGRRSSRIDKQRGVHGGLPRMFDWMSPSSSLHGGSRRPGARFAFGLLRRLKRLACVGLFKESPRAPPQRTGRAQRLVRSCSAAREVCSTKSSKPSFNA